MKICIIGAGNVAWHLAKALKKSGEQIVQIFSPTPNHAVELALQVGAEGLSDWTKINTQVDLYILAVKDEAISAVSLKLKGTKAFVLHPSGTTPMQVLADFENYGVLYPLQTISKIRPLDFQNVPLFLEANHPNNLKVLHELALKLSIHVSFVDSSQRTALHIAAVFASNFTNHFYTIAANILEQVDLNFDLIKPLILETAEKIRHALPSEMQTGPAIRNDQKTIKSHLDSLQEYPDWQHIYQIVTANIKKTHT